MKLDRTNKITRKSLARKASEAKETTRLSSLLLARVCAQSGLLFVTPPNIAR